MDKSASGQSMDSPLALLSTIRGEGCYHGQLPVLPGMDVLIVNNFFHQRIGEVLPDPRRN